MLAALATVVAAIIYNVACKVVEEPTQVREVPGEGLPMVAVLPFTTVSKEGDNEFFATGIHDDLVTQLAQVQSIRVMSRTSVMEYKDTVRNIREIGQALGADAVLEGGIQSSGNRIRINASSLMP
jgi:TolB-like protein